MPGWKRNIGLFLAGQSATMVGSMLVSFAVLWHLTLRTQSGWVTTAVIVFGMLPQAVVSLWGGPWADRYNRKTLLVVGSLGTAVATVVLALLLHGGVTDLWIFYLTMAVRSMLMGITTPAASAAIPGIVPATQLMRVNGINEAIASAALLVSPLVTGGIYETLGLVPIFVIDVGTSLLAVTFVMFLPALRAEPSAATEPDAPAAAPETGPRVLCELRAGLRYVASQAAVRWLLVIYALAMTVAAAPSFLTPLMMARSFGPDVWRLTANEMFWAAGSLLAGLVMMSFGPRIKRHLRVILVALVATGFLSVAIGLSTNMWVYLGLLFLIAVAFSAITVPEFTMLQQMVDPAMLGRVFGLVSIITSVSMSAAMLVLGPLADVVSVESILVVSGALLVAVIAGLLGFRSLRGLLADAPAAPAASLVEPPAGAVVESDAKELVDAVV